MAEHLAILSPEEVHLLYQRPAFDWQQRARYFSFTPAEAQRAEQFATPVSKLYFLLQLGYFKAKQQFFAFDLAEARTDFLRVFTHVLERRARQRPEKRDLVACVVAFGTNHGLGDLAKRSDLGYADLAGTSHNFIRQETLLEANKHIIEATAELPMFAHYHLEPDRLHSSSDGQKYGTQFETINARYSPKYFGLSKGVTAYTLVLDHIPLQTKVIGANEHESHYVLDLLYTNRSAFGG